MECCVPTDSARAINSFNISISFLTIASSIGLKYTALFIASLAIEPGNRFSKCSLIPIKLTPGTSTGQKDRCKSKASGGIEDTVSFSFDPSSTSFASAFSKLNRIVSGPEGIPGRSPVAISRLLMRFTSAFTGSFFVFFNLLFISSSRFLFFSSIAFCSSTKRLYCLALPSKMTLEASLLPHRTARKRPVVQLVVFSRHNFVKSTAFLNSSIAPAAIRLKIFKILSTVLRDVV
mmetsp:Transcript_27872/g.41333  ORF Transcript_27872/g.41333 Transcript_27872/m.41333 type:complete len:233 (-) Transcript_27872:111-809(-)